MEQIADPGAIVITPETLALAEGYVEVKSLGPVPVKGLADAVEVYEVTGAGPARTRLQAAARRGLTRFVGRDAELEQLCRAQELAGEGHGQVAAIVGEAGVGKSRLVYEFAHSHRLQGWLVLESASVSYGKAQLGEASEAPARLREAEQLLERRAARGLVGNSGWAYLSLGRTCLLLGRLDEAQRLGDRAVESSPCHPGFAAHALHLLGDIATHPDRFDAETGGAHYRQALALAEPRGMRPLVAHCHLGLGKLSRRMAQREQAREHLTIATTMYREMDMRFWLAQAEAEARELGA
jgi:tetratricopeptide (TPR) repeat protein